MALAAMVMSQHGLMAEDGPGDQRAKVRMFFKGMKLYESQCLPCHGSRGRGDGPWAADLMPKPRDFRSGTFKFRSTPYGMLPTDGDLRRTIRSGISGTAMPAFGKLTNEDIGSLIAYIKSFSKRWTDKEAQAEAMKLPATPSWFADDKKVAVHAREGSLRFQTNCASCHGQDGRGDGPASKDLVDEWGVPIVAADLRRKHHKSGDNPADLYRTISSGMSGTPMIGFASSLSEAQIWEIVAFIKSNEVDELQRTGGIDPTGSGRQPN